MRKCQYSRRQRSTVLCTSVKHKDSTIFPIFVASTFVKVSTTENANNCKKRLWSDGTTTCGNVRQRELFQRRLFDHGATVTTWLLFLRVHTEMYLIMVNWEKFLCCTFLSTFVALSVRSSCLLLIGRKNNRNVLRASIFSHLIVLYFTLQGFVFLYIYIQITFSYSFDLKMTLSKRRNVVAFLKFFDSF